MCRTSSHKGKKNDRFAVAGEDLSKGEAPEHECT